MEYAQKSLDSIDTKQKDLVKLIEDIEKNIESYEEKPDKIESVGFAQNCIKTKQTKTKTMC